MRHYEVTFIVDPVLSGDEIKATAKSYVDQLRELKCSIVHVDEMGLKQLAYPINRRTSGVYFCIEFTTETGAMIQPLELSLRRDERILRFLTYKLDKYGVKYNDDKRNGRIGKKRDKASEEVKDEAKKEKAGKNVRQQDKKERAKQVKAKPVATEEEEE